MRKPPNPKCSPAPVSFKNLTPRPVGERYGDDDLVPPGIKLKQKKKKGGCTSARKPFLTSHCPYYPKRRFGLIPSFQAIPRRLWSCLVPFPEPTPGSPIRTTSPHFKASPTALSAARAAASSARNIPHLYRKTPAEDDFVEEGD
ncbi:unnamed protein product [Phytomonas sp. Hart1]|nr:unnamed protein product [Phytomonas sp. Hart1]|eukprot:CCW69292.1 unnamed protein product [Phytomonas sp. isolate Hart1]